MRESKESAHKYFLVLDSYILPFQDRTSAVDHVSTLGVTKCIPLPPLENPGYAPAVVAG